MIDIAWIRDNLIGQNQVLETPFGARKLVYADYTASGRSLAAVEDFIRQQVMPVYANTHTETSHSGRQSTAFREEARDIIANAVNADEGDAVIFCGAGATAAINKLVDLLDIKLPRDPYARQVLQKSMIEDMRPVVLVGPYEHHSNDLPWRETIAHVEEVTLDKAGHIDLADLEARLQRYQNRPMLIGSFSAASNVTGIKSDVDAISRLVHQYGGYVFFDYAAGAPYMGMDMHPESDSTAYKDAIFFSPHKFVGGPGTPGVLVLRREMIRHHVPAQPGGGTVAFVSAEDHRYTENFVSREEGGTPEILGAIRAGMAMQVKEAIGHEEIENRETDFRQRALDIWEQNPAIEVLGSPREDSLSIMSLRIKKDGHFLHHQFAVALLNDLFGIQIRGGCSCAGPYAHYLLGISQEESAQLDSQLQAGHEILKPGWIRLNFNYFIDEAEFRFLVDAVDWVARHGWRLISLYDYDQESGCWIHQDGRADVLSLAGFETVTTTTVTAPPADRNAMFDQANAVFSSLPEIPETGARFDKIDIVNRWHWLPRDLIKQAA